MLQTFSSDWIAQQIGDTQSPVANDQTSRADASLADLTPLAKAASVLGDKIDPALLATILNMDPAQLQPLLNEWALNGGVTQANGHYRFTQPHARLAAYANVPPDLRQSLHARAADTLSLRSKFHSIETAEQIANHLENAARPQAAFSWWMKAADYARQEEQPSLAAGFLKRAIAVSAANPSRIAPEAELSALKILGPLLAQSKGSGSDDVALVYERCLEIADGLQRTGSAATFDVLWGLSACILVQGRIETATELSERLVRAAQHSGDETQVLLATRLKALTQLLAGNIDAALAEFEVVKELSEAGDHSNLRFRYASDQRAVSRSHQAWAEAISGQTVASERSHKQALQFAEELRHPHTSAHVMCVLAARAQTLDDRTAAAPLANAGRTIARLHHFPYWEAWANLILGWHDAAKGTHQAIARIDNAIEAYQRTGAGQALPYAHLLRASVAHAAGWQDMAAASADVGLCHTNAYGVALFKVELLLVKAKATSNRNAQRLIVEQAIEIARTQGTRLFEARALQFRDHLIATSMAFAE